MKLKDKIILITLALLAFATLMYLVRSVLSPFIYSLVIAYFLNPLVDRLHIKYRLSRFNASLLILCSFFVSLIAIAATLAPIVYSQLVELSDSLPDYLKIFTEEFYPKIATKLNAMGFKLATDFSFFNEEIIMQSADLSKKLLQNAATSSLNLINILSLIFIIPILVFYLLKDWDILVRRVFEYLPNNFSPVVKDVVAEIDQVLSGYVRGQFNVCFILSLIYSILLSFTGLNFGFIIGLLTGLFSFIPYLGMASGLGAAIIASLFQWGLDLSNLTIVIGIFIFGQIVESNFLTPKLVGSKIGLHPVWIIFGFFFFAALFGIIGVIAAIPLTAVCGVIIKYLAAKYKKKLLSKP